MKKLYVSFENYMIDIISSFNNHKQLVLLTISGIIFINLAVLFLPNIVNGHDLTFHLSRISSIADALKLGEIPRVYPNYFSGYGYANGLFYGDILLYIPAFLVALGMNVIVAYKFLLLLVTILTAISIYFCTKTLSQSNYGSLIAVLLCILSSYRRVDIFVRASLAEVMAFIFIPLILVGLYHVLYNDDKRWYWLSIGFGGCFLTHNISFALMFGFTFLFVCFSLKRLWIERSRLMYLVIATFVTIGIVAYLLFPMIEQLISDQFILTTQTIHSDLSQTTRSILAAFLGLYRHPVGIVGIGVIFLLVLIWRWNKKNDQFKLNQFTDQMYLFSILSIWATTSLFPWKLVIKLLSPLSMIQFSWRLFLIITIFLSILGGIYLSKIAVSFRLKFRYFLICLLVTLIPFTIHIGKQYAVHYYHIYITKLIAPVELTNYGIGQGEYLPVNIDPDWLIERGDIITSNNSDIDVEFNRLGLTLDVVYNQATTDTYLDLPLIYYKGYKASDEKLIVVKSDEGLVRILLNGSESGKFTVSYEGTPLGKITSIISIITVAGLLRYIYKINKNGDTYIGTEKFRKYEKIIK